MTQLQGLGQLRQAYQTGIQLDFDLHSENNYVMTLHKGKGYLVSTHSGSYYCKQKHSRILFI